jgi:zinc and cadmium transporter
MSVLLWILVSSLAGGMLSVAAAVAVAFKAGPAPVPDFISFAVGALLGAVFLAILPHAFRAASGAQLLGGLLGYAAFYALQTWAAYLLGVVAAGMIYVAVADLIPGLHRRPGLEATTYQVALIGLGIGSVWLVRVLASHVG